MADWITIVGVLVALLVVFIVYIMFKSLVLWQSIVFSVLLAIFIGFVIIPNLYPGPGSQTPVNDEGISFNTTNGGGLRRWFNEKKMSSGKLTGALFAVITALIYSVYRSAQTFLLLTSS